MTLALITMRLPKLPGAIRMFVDMDDASTKTMLDKNVQECGAHILSIKPVNRETHFPDVAQQISDLSEAAKPGDFYYRGCAQ
jgi:hypothetical protein